MTEEEVEPELVSHSAQALRIVATMSTRLGCGRASVCLGIGAFPITLVEGAVEEALGLVSRPAVTLRI